MPLFLKIKDNFQALAFNGPHFLQFLYVIKMLWWGIGGILGVRFINPYLNYLVEYPVNIVLIIVGLVGTAGLFFNRYILNILFAFSVMFITSKVGISFIQNASQTISTSNYFIDIFGAVWLVWRIQTDHLKEERYLEYRGKKE